jgi:polar amino acid transport system substrate-binding protein
MKTVSGLRVLSLIVVLVLTAAATSSPGFAQSTLEEIQKRGKLLAGVRYDFPPNGYIDIQGNHIGFGPDIAREFAKHLGVGIEFVQVTSKNRIPLLLNRQIDADIGATTPNKTRDEVIDFSYTYVVDRGVIMVRQGDSIDPEDYFNTDKIVGTTQGSNLFGLWKDHSPAANMKQYQEYPEVVIALAQGKIDVMPVPESTALELIEKLGDRASNIAVGGTFFRDPLAIGVRENDSNWRDWVNWALQRMWADGTFQKIYKKHYKMEPSFRLGDAGWLQPRYERIAKKNDPW